MEAGGEALGEVDGTEGAGEAEAAELPAGDATTMGKHLRTVTNKTS